MSFSNSYNVRENKGDVIVYFDPFLYVFMAPKIITRSFAIKLSYMLLRTGRPIILLLSVTDRMMFQLREKMITLLLCKETDGGHLELNAATRNFNIFYYEEEVIMMKKLIIITKKELL